MLAVGTVVFVVAGQLVVGRSPRFLGLLTIPPFVSVVQRSRLATALVGLASVSAAGLVGAVQGLDTQVALTTAVVAAASLLAVWVSSLRLRLAEALQIATELATVDPLTGALNRRALLAQARALTALRPAVRPPLAVFMVDLDDLKQVNDRWGHGTGDQVLVEIVRRIRLELRSGDLLCRYGGDEFLVVGVGLTGADGRNVAERLCASIGGRRFDLDGLRLTLSASIGVTTVRDHEGSPEGAMERADRALYLTKAAGGGRVTVVD